HRTQRRRGREGVVLLMAQPADSFDEVPAEGSPEPEVHLADYWAVIVKRWRLILLCLLVTLAAGGLFIVLSTPAYEGVTVLDIARSNMNPVGLAGAVPVEGISEFLPSQVELLKSRDVAERVVKSLNLLNDPEFLEAFPKLAPDDWEPGKKLTPRQPTASLI